jgi:hypothetical protein
MLGRVKKKYAEGDFMHRLIIVGMLAMSLSGCVSIADHARPERLPIVDFHTHLNGDMETARLLELMDRAGVRTMVLMARYYANPRDAGYGSDLQAADFARKHKGRFLPFIAGQRGELGRLSLGTWQNPEGASWYLREAEERLRSGEFFGLGEYILFHHAYDLRGWGQIGNEVRLPADSPLMHRISALGAKYGVPVLFHLEAEPEQTEQAVRLFEANPDTTFIWAHNCGRASADQIRRLLERFPRLTCDLGGMMVTPNDRGGYGRYWPKHTPYIHLVQADGGKVYPEMLRLFEDFSDRFLLGTDTAHTPALRFYEERIEAFRQMLSQMSPATAKRIAHENADRLFAARRIP